MVFNKVPWLALSCLLVTSRAASSLFDSQISPCPQPCSTVGTSSSNWTAYNSLSRLERCGETVLFDFNVFNHFDTLGSFRACTADITEGASTTEKSPTCPSSARTPVSWQATSWRSTEDNAFPVSSFEMAVKALEDQVTGSLGCTVNEDSTILFAHQGSVVVGLYLGSGIDRTTPTQELAHRAIRIAHDFDGVDTLALQACQDINHTASDSPSVGLVVSRNRNHQIMSSVIQSWMNSTCIKGGEVVTSGIIPIALMPPSSPRVLSTGKADACSYIMVESGDTCATLSKKCDITAAQLAEFNPGDTLCSTLAVRQPICCSAGSLPDLSPQPGQDGSCFDYTVKSGDYCALLAEKYYVTVDEIEAYNSKTWGWMGCANLHLGAVICLSSGDPPMPAPVSGAVCGPQVEGTKRPNDWSDIGSLNPCPLNACCDVWGQCGITPEFCTKTESSTGAPGTAAPNTNGCISNCGTDIVNNASAVSDFLNIGYFEAFGVNRACLNMGASQLPSSYTHVHFAFGQISADFTVDITGYEDQFKVFAAQTYFRRILSFGGWSFSTDLDSYPIFREGVTDANRLAFAQSVVDFVSKWNLDGVDFDWEYPGAPDIPGIPPGSPTDGANYLKFLKTVRSLLPAEKSISIAAPASYWYLKGFPIAEMADILDYIVYMTYDLHGQWDYDNSFVNPGCPTGNCLRSHVNLTETEYALSMITKAGVPANKVVVGIASYGRSFGMEDPNCTGPQCRFTGPNSTATPGECTVTSGYISQAELTRIANSNTRLNRRGVTSWHDESSNSDLMTYGDGSTWVAYLSPETKISRLNLYSGYGFGGTVEWALDLTSFVTDEDAPLTTAQIEAAEDQFRGALELSGYDISGLPEENVTLLATRLRGFTECKKRFGPNAEKIITSGWQQSWKIMNFIKKLVDKGINYNEAGEMEYLAPPGHNEEQRPQFEAIFKNLATVQTGWWPDWWDWTIYICCDDPHFKCPCVEGSGNSPGARTVAYTVQRDRSHLSPFINFCEPYFDYNTLDAVIKEWTNKNLHTTSERLDLSNYVKNQASVWIHELLHIDWVSTASVADNGIDHIADIRISFKSEDPVWYAAYGPFLTKGLARLGFSAGWWVVRNADSLAMYTLAKGWEIPAVFPGMFTIYPNGTGEPAEDTSTINGNEWIPGQGVCGAADDGSGAAGPAYTATTYAVQSDYPEDYLSSWSSWAGLTPTTTTTATATPTPSYPWSVNIYRGADCKGDHYVVSGDGRQSMGEPCAVIQKLDTEDTLNCKWYTDGSDDYTSCGGAGLTQPLSWRVVTYAGLCTAYANDRCEADGYQQAYGYTEGCVNYDEDNFDAETWIAVSCGVGLMEGQAVKSQYKYRINKSG